ncbi:hypothetical protein HYX05_00100 [Candidatus Woesearchaeota archaeon]|nr:hypothetical protein [Candidatus Woesearchaeota archaeon]
MVQVTEYVGLLPASVDVKGIEYIVDPNIGDFVRVPIDRAAPKDDIGKVARFLTQLASKHVDGDIRVNDYSVPNSKDVLSENYCIEKYRDSGSAVSDQTLYTIYTVTIKKLREPDNPNKFVSLRSDPNFTKGSEILRAFIEEAKAQLKPAK